MKDSFSQKHLFLMEQNEASTWRIQRGGQGLRTPPPLKNRKNIGFLSNIDLDPLKITRPPSQHSMVGPLSARQRNAISMAFLWQADDGPLFSGITILFPSHQLKKQQHQCWTSSDKTVWIRACIHIDIGRKIICGY